MKFATKKQYGIFVLFSVFVTMPALAQTNQLTGTVNSRLVITSGCAINTGDGSTTTSGAFGTLDFGTQPGTFTGSLSTQVNGSGATNTQISCTPDISSLNVTVNGGLNANQGVAIGSGTRAVVSSGNYVPYEVYTDISHSTVYVANAPKTIAITAPGTAFAFPIYAVANKTSATSLPAGTYTDTLNVTVAW